MRAGRRFQAALETLPPTLSDADRRLAHEIAAGVLRTRRALDAAVAPFVDRGWRRTSAAVKDVLRIGVYQLQRLARVPPYAAVKSTVELARTEVGDTAAAFVNAVLRRVAAGTPGGDEPDLARRYSHPRWLVDRWLAAFGAARTEALLQHNNRRPPLTLQPARQSLEELQAALDAAGVRWRPAALGHGVTVSASDVRSLPGYDAGAFIVQDAGHAELLARAAIPPGARVWDACAAPGGKAVILSRHSRVYASDARQSRIPRLRDTLRRAAPEVPLFVADARRPPVGAAEFDAVVVDAPCSATGTMARHPDARWRLTPRRITRLAVLQREILDGVAPAVRPGGRLVYLTCSLEREENEDQVTAFTERHPAFAREGPDTTLFPPETGTGGGYVARLVRT